MSDQLVNFFVAPLNFRFQFPSTNFPNHFPLTIFH